MSKEARTRKHKAKMERKRAAKLARKNLYASLAGTSRRRKRRGRSARHSSTRGLHVMSNCGNIGCARCFASLNK